MFSEITFIDWLEVALAVQLGAFVVGAIFTGWSPVKIVCTIVIAFLLGCVIVANIWRELHKKGEKNDIYR